MCNVAAGTIDAYIDIGDRLRMTDFAAAYLILKEAGAIMKSANGQEIDSKLGPTRRISLLAVANQALFDQIFSTM